MEFLGRVIVYPTLWIVDIMLPFLNGSLSSLPSIKASFPLTVSIYRELLAKYPSEREFLCASLGQLCLYFFLLLPMGVGSWYIVWIIANDTTTHNRAVTFLLSIPTGFYWFIIAFTTMPNVYSLVVFLTALVPCVECLFYFLRLFIYLVIKAVTHIFIVGLKNRRACQFLSALAAVLLGVTKAKVYAAIPIAYGIFLTIPDLDPDPWMSFKLRFSHFLMANMDEESLNAVLYSKSFKMVSSNEMMPVLRPVRPRATTVACFVLKETSTPEDGHFTIEQEYIIGLGSVTTATRQNEIDVQIFTPYSGVKRRTMKNTPSARYNLDMSARFWRDHPEVGILNEDIRAYKHYDEAKMHCISIDKWISFCGSENYVFMEYNCESFDTSHINALMIALKGGQ